MPATTTNRLQKGRIGWGPQIAHIIKNGVAIPKGVMASESGADGIVNLDDSVASLVFVGVMVGVNKGQTPATGDSGGTIKGVIAKSGSFWFVAETGTPDKSWLGKLLFGRFNQSVALTASAGNSYKVGECIDFDGTNVEVLINTMLK